MSLRTPKRSRTNEEQEQQEQEQEQQEQGQGQNQNIHTHQYQQRPGTTPLSTPVRVRNGFGTPSPPSPPSTTNSITKSKRRTSTTVLQGIFMSPVNKRRVGTATRGRVYGHNEDGHETGSEDDDENENENENDSNEHDGQAGTTLLPPTTPKSRRSEVFLSPSPRLRSPPTAAANRPSAERPIREISHTLRTRLNYAMVKLQNGWTEKTLPELETELAPAVQTSPRRYHNRFPDSADTGTSAHSAFLQALGGHPPREEATAVETLMLLSSPTKKQQHRSVLASSVGSPTDETEPETDTDEVETS
ncbi:whi5p [Saccharomyces arboricola H-6]|uniref:Whi5p n=1 Tax=Saccharomyces arboricola (strain H-6 / AS 2.3317 / CBS 10644) TaxID=1160507 RepID=J8PHW5_SACAR|nr:whi5p [Saccharomyces arboricola H-6]